MHNAVENKIHWVFQNIPNNLSQLGRSTGQFYPTNAAEIKL